MITMSITVTWDNTERTIIRWTFPENWTWEDAQGAVSVEAQMANQVEHIVYAIGDLLPTRVIPPGAMRSVKHIMASRHLRIGLTVLITDSYYVTTMVNMIRATVHRQFMEQSRLIVVSTERDAYAAIETERGNKNTSLSR